MLHFCTLFLEEESSLKPFAGNLFLGANLARVPGTIESVCVLCIDAVQCLVGYIVLRGLLMLLLSPMLRIILCVASRVPMGRK